MEKPVDHFIKSLGYKDGYNGNVYRVFKSERLKAIYEKEYVRGAKDREYADLKKIMNNDSNDS